MAASDSFNEEGDQRLAAEGGSSTTTSFSKLLFSNDDEDDDHMGHLFYSHPPKMLCFGGNKYSYKSTSEEEAEILLLCNDHQASKCSGVTCSDNSSSASSGNKVSTVNNIVNSNSKPNRKRSTGSSQEQAKAPSLANQKSIKKTKVETNITSSIGHTKVRKEKLGERITALQQLVSPFGKTDTASVLHEAMGYIRFLHDQVQVLCSPYLHHLPVGGGEEENGGNEEESGDAGKELRSRGLCLVPLEFTMHVAGSNGADYWSPALMATKR